MRATVRSNAVVGVTSITWPHDRAEQMMVVVQEVLGHLESRELVTRGDSTHDAGPLEVREVPVGRTPRHLGDARFDVRDAERTFRGRQEFDDGAAARGVALIDPAQ